MRVLYIVIISILVVARAESFAFNNRAKIDTVSASRTPLIRQFDLIHTDLKLKPIWPLHQMQGEATLKLSPYFYHQNEILIDAVSFKIDKVDVFLKGKSIYKSHEYDSLKLKVFFLKEITKKDTIIVNIIYTAIPDSAKEENGVALKENKGLYFINTDNTRKNVPMHLWTQGETSANSHWFPTIDLPSEKQTQTLQITIDKNLVSLSNGKLVKSIAHLDGTKTDYWEQKLPHSVYLTVLVVGNYKIVKDKWGAKEVNYYMEPQYESLARPIFGRTKEMLDFFSKKLNIIYPWDKYSQVIVHDFIAGAMENTSAVTFNSFVQKDARELIDDNDDETIAHELFHHWFGNLVTAENWAHITLNESFANYSEYLWHEHKNGIDAAQEFWERDFNGYLLRANKKKESLVRYNYNNPDDMFDVISYQKGGKIVHQLRNYIGDEAFFKSLERYLKRHQFSTAEYSDFRKVVEEVTGQDLMWYFNQWYLKGGHPVLTVSSKKSDTGVFLFLAQKHNFDSTFIYKLPIELDIYTGTKVDPQVIWFDRRTDTIFIATASPVLASVINSKQSLVGEIKETKPVEEWIYILKNAPDYLTQKKALKKLKAHRFNPIVKEAIYQSLFSKKPLLVIESIDLIEEEWVKKELRFRDKITEIAEKNTVGKVRARALEALNIDTVKLGYVKLAKKLLKDSSYLVEIEAIKLLKNTDSNYVLQHALSQPFSNNYNHLNSLFDIISNAKDSNCLYKFNDALDKVMGYQRIAVVSNYGRWVAHQSDNIYNNALDLFDIEYKSNAETAKYSGASGYNVMIGELEKYDTENYKKRLVKAKERYKKLTEKDQNEWDNEF